MRLHISLTRTLLVIAPHPDDETIGAFGLMARMRRRGANVRVVVVSDGAGSHRDSRSWPSARLIRERRRETRNAARRIGVYAPALTFLELPDGGLAEALSNVTRLVGREVRRAPKPLLVISPAPTDDHPDHRAVAMCVATLRVAGVRRLAYPVWPAGSGLRFARTFMLTARERFAKRSAIRNYRTQTGRIVDDPLGFAMSPTQIAAFARPAETFVAF
ncbi:PIG-L deacetylase family protein [Sphingomonas nostoxanthinifaciens]|uniref:PIG-L deacetylase family protein n=1 Tax=Sphingomonas nostoxanthinifaciens TaxID=2872652 RepID=UPI001CC2151F|nr:PIG-L family deacetylase [Sphingomonas nostoxanthinifaciens]UAK23835.1 PIG-L family deacetylase [Sphingomonas nostoxanthinifaciens]